MTIKEKGAMLMMGVSEDAPIYGDFRLLAKWDYTMGLPDTTVWNYPIGTGRAGIDTGGWLYFEATGGQDYSGIRLFDFPIKKALIDVTINVESTDANGIRILAGSGENSVGNQITINGGYLNVLKGNDTLTKITRTFIFNSHEWHRICVGIDKDKNDNRVYLDNALVATVQNGNLNTSYASNTWLLAQKGAFHLKQMSIYGS